MDDEKIPVEKVLEDMYSPEGGPVSWAARDYFRTYYATDEEKKLMDLEDKMENTFATVFWIIYLMIVIGCICICLFK